MSFKLQVGVQEDDGYRIVGPGGEEGEFVDFGVPASLKIESGPNKGEYTALVGSPDRSEWEPPEGIVFVGRAVETEVQQVQLQYEGEPEPEEGEGEEDVEPGDGEPGEGDQS